MSEKKDVLLEAEPEPAAEEPEDKSFGATCRKIATWTWDLACEHWFILGVGFAIGFAAAVPNFGRTGGWIRSEWSVKYGAVIVIFFLSGIGLKTKVLTNAGTRLPLHLLIQIICLGITPLIGWGVASVMKLTPMSSELVTGIVICACMPTTVSTNVVFTKDALGNEAVSLINAVIGNIIGIFVSPGLLQIYIGAKSGGSTYTDVIANLAITVIAPLVVGQLCQTFLPKQVKLLTTYVNSAKVSSTCILLLVWATFCNSFYSKVTTDAGSIIVTIITQQTLYVFFTALCIGIALFPPFVKWLSLDRSDAVAIAMCGATKTIALGFPLITVLYGNLPDVGLLSLPLLIYHPSQIVIGSMLIKPFRRWVQEEQKLPEEEGGSLRSGSGHSSGNNGVGETPVTALTALGGVGVASVPVDGGVQAEIRVDAVSPEDKVSPAAPPSVSLSPVEVIESPSPVGAIAEGGSQGVGGAVAPLS